MSKALREIQAFPKTARVIAEEALSEVEKLRALNAELVEALNLCYDHLRLYRPEVESNNVGSAVQAALAKAKELNT